VIITLITKVILMILMITVVMRSLKWSCGDHEGSGPNLLFATDDF